MDTRHGWKGCTLRGANVGPHLCSMYCPPFSDVYNLSDVSWCPLIFLGQYLSIVPIYIMIILAYMVWNSRFVHDGLWCFRLFPSEMLITKFIYFLLMFHMSHSKLSTISPHMMWWTYWDLFQLQHISNVMMLFTDKKIQYPLCGVFGTTYYCHCPYGY